jgi:hypothetical protein
MTEIAGQVRGTVRKDESPLFLGPALESFSEAERPLGRGKTDGAEDLAIGGGIDFSPGSGAAKEGEAESDPVLSSEPESASADSQVPFQDEDEFDFHMAAEIKEENSENAGGQEFAAADRGEVREAEPDAETAGTEGDKLAATLEKVSLDFEGLDMSDLSPEGSAESENQGREETEEAPFDLWSLSDSSEGDEETAALFDDLAKTSKKSDKAAPAEAEEADADNDD